LILEARLRSLRGAVVIAGKRPRNRAPEQIRRRNNEAARRELVGDCADVHIDAVNGGGKHNGRSWIVGLGHDQITAKLTSIA